MRGMADDELGALSGALNMASNVATAFKVSSHKQGNTVWRSKDKSDRASVEQVPCRRPASPNSCSASPCTVAASCPPAFDCAIDLSEDEV